MITISFYDSQGKITGSVAQSHDQYELTKDRLDPHVEGDWYDKDVYVSNGGVHPRPQNPAQLDGLHLTHLPAPGAIHIDDASYPYDDTTVELEFEHPGTYRVRVECWPYLDKEFEIENPPR